MQSSPLPEIGRSLAAILREAFSTRRIVYQGEDELQLLIAGLLTELKVTFVREFEFGRANRVDFWIFKSGTAIEVKIGGSLLPTLHQMKRYADLPAVKEVILICPKPWKLPVTLSGKPVYCVALYGSMI